MEKTLPSESPVHLTPDAQPVSQSKIKLLVLLLLTVVVCAVFFGSAGFFLGKQTVRTQPFVSSQVSSTGPLSVTSTPAPEQTPNLGTYTNNKLAFSIHIPSHMVVFGGGCQYNQTEQSYRPQTSAVPVVTFEDGNSVYLTHDYYYFLGGEQKTTRGVGTVSSFSTCNKVTNTLELLKDQKNFHENKWKIIVETVKNDTELNSFIQKTYGSGCHVGEQQPSKQEGVYDVTINGDGKDLGETQCPINYLLALKYYPEKQKVATWALGQACTFFTEDQTCLDSQISESFRFN